MVVLIRKLRDVLVTIFDASDPAHCLKRFDLNDAGNISRSIENSNLKYQTEEFFKFFLHKYGLYIILLHLKQKKGMEDGYSWLLCETRNAFHTDTEVLSK